MKYVFLILYFQYNNKNYNKKLAPYGTNGRLLLTANFKVT